MIIEYPAPRWNQSKTKDIIQVLFWKRINHFGYLPSQLKYLSERPEGKSLNLQSKPNSWNSEKGIGWHPTVIKVTFVWVWVLYFSQFWVDSDPLRSCPTKPLLSELIKIGVFSRYHLIYLCILQNLELWNVYFENMNVGKYDIIAFYELRNILQIQFSNV